MKTRGCFFIAWIAAACWNLLGSDARCLAQALPANCGTTGIAGPLRVSSVNPRYFTNDCGKAIFMTGSHTWNNFPDMDDAYPPENQPFDFTQYLDFLDRYNHNFIRLWAWEGPHPDNADRYARRVWAGPQPWLRTGPGNDITGLPKFDLTRWNQAYFDRLRQRVSQAQARGKFVSVMLFEGWELQSAPGALSHPFNSANNVNGISFGSAVTNIHTMNVPAITAIQEDYVRRVVDAVNDYDNVLYEIANEAGSYSTSWQYHMIGFVKQYEAGKPKRHPVGMTYQFSGGVNPTLFASAAEWVSPGRAPSYPYDTSPPANDGGKVVFNDNDHIDGSSFADRVWVWKSFTRGLNVLFMDRYDLPYSITNGPIPEAMETRNAMGSALSYSRRMDLLHAVPNAAISSTGYALESPVELLVYSPSSSSFTVNLANHPGTLDVEWFNAVTRQATAAGTVTGGATRTFQPPFGNDGVLYIRNSNPTGASPSGSPPKALVLGKPSPNPANPVTRIPYELPAASLVRIEIYDPAGRRVAELLNRVVSAGRWEVTWDGRDLHGARVPSGMWLVRMTAAGRALTQKILIVR